MTQTRPPFHADHVGSLLRSASVTAARKAHFQDHSLSADALRRVEDDSISVLIAMRENVGLKAVTDGEARRSFWHYDFMGMLDGFDLVERDEGVQFAGVKLRPIFPSISGKLGFPADHPMLESFRFVAQHTNVTLKISTPGPSCCHFSTAQEDISPAEYKDPELLMADIAAQEQDTDWLIDRYAWMMHEAIKDRPDDMLIGMHMCRGNFHSTHAATGAYDPAADAVFNKTGVDIYFMEYDSERAGGLEPLRLLPKGKKRMLPGFITTKTGDLESVDDLRRQFDVAGKFADLDQLGIAPQCGFASTEEGNAISEDDQRRKLELVVKTAEAIWGEV